LRLLATLHFSFLKGKCILIFVKTIKAISSNFSKYFINWKVSKKRVNSIKVEEGIRSKLGSALLSRGLSRSIIGAEGLNGRVRDGIVCFPLAITTKLTSYPFNTSLIT
jgi:hypothetical protein